MLAVIYWASRRLLRYYPDLGSRYRLAAGLFALALLLGAEMLVACGMGVRSISQYLASRDPVSGGVYLASLLAFPVAPAIGKASPLPGPTARHE